MGAVYPRTKFSFIRDVFFAHVTERFSPIGKFLRAKDRVPKVPLGTSALGMIKMVEIELKVHSFTVR